MHHVRYVSYITNSISNDKYHFAERIFHKSIGLDYVRTRYFQPRISICPTCRVPFDGQPYRLYFAERLLEERVPIACRFAEDGCKVGFQISISPLYNKTKFFNTNLALHINLINLRVSSG